MIKHIITLIILSSILASCSEKTQEEAKNKENIENALAEEEKAMAMEPQVSDNTIIGLISSIPPPIELSALIIEQDVNYDNKLLHNTSIIKNYQNSYSQALNLGVYGTDLGYTHLYEQTSDGLVYFDCVMQLSHELNIEKYFDSKTITKLTRSNNLDSLLNLTTENFSQINNHFIEQKTPQLSISLLAGGWIESLYLISKTYEAKPTDKLKEKIAEQKVSLELLEEIMASYSSDPKIKELLNTFIPLIDAYKKVTITNSEPLNTLNDTQWNDEESTMIYKPSSETIITIEEEDFNHIISKISSIRTQLIN